MFIERTQRDVENGAFVARNGDGIRTRIPVEDVVCLMLEQAVQGDVESPSLRTGELGRFGQPQPLFERRHCLPAKTRGSDDSGCRTRTFHRIPVGPPVAGERC